ncbi:MAG: hypothetical protein LBU88_00845, partial [Treponema sp.]|nr:hypothetical protein [Treponema sp.]
MEGYTTMPRKTIIILLALIAIVTIAFTGCAAKTEPYFDIYSIKSYRDIPGVTGEEIAAIEALKAEGRSFSFGNIYSTEGFVLSDGSCTGF